MIVLKLYLFNLNQFFLISFILLDIFIFKEHFIEIDFKKINMNLHTSYYLNIKK